jgi:hypothetical protein
MDSDEGSDAMPDARNNLIGKTADMAEKARLAVDHARLIGQNEPLDR